MINAYEISYTIAISPFVPKGRIVVFEDEPLHLMVVAASPISDLQAIAAISQYVAACEEVGRPFGELSEAQMQNDARHFASDN